MNRTAPLLLAALSGSLGGCGATKTLDSVGRTVGDQTPAIVNLPNFATPSPIVLVKDGSKLAVGADWRAALDLFPQPPKAFVVDELPPGLKPPFVARGWETSTDGFGGILVNGHIALAMYQKEKVDEDELLALIDGNRSEMRSIVPVNIVQPRVRFWIWDDGHRRTMIGSLTTAKSGLNVTLATGDDGVCDVLGISTAGIQADAARAAQLLALPRDPSGSKSSR